jgi:hypothetical protein
LLFRRLPCGGKERALVVVENHIDPPLLVERDHGLKVLALDDHTPGHVKPVEPAHVLHGVGPVQDDRAHAFNREIVL